MEELLKSVLGSERCPSMAMLKESFIELDVIKPLKQRGVLRSVDPLTRLAAALLLGCLSALIRSHCLEAAYCPKLWLAGSASR